MSRQTENRCWQVLGLVGETGAGKSLTALALLGLLRPPAKVVAGKIQFEGQELGLLDQPGHRSPRGKSITLLVAGLIIGAVVGKERLMPVDPLFVGLFTGALTLFLLELGVTAAERMRDVKEAGIRLVLLGIAIPLFNGLIGAAAASLAGLSTGGVAIMATLAGSASYIAAPAAVKAALPSASPGLYVTASLGITFPFNLTIGIPIYIGMANLLS
jgi:hypothetical protein